MRIVPALLAAALFGGCSHGYTTLRPGELERLEPPPPGKPMGLMIKLKRDGYVGGQLDEWNVGGGLARGRLTSGERIEVRLEQVEQAYLLGQSEAQDLADSGEVRQSGGALLMILGAGSALMSGVVYLFSQVPDFCFSNDPDGCPHRSNDGPAVAAALGLGGIASLIGGALLHSSGTRRLEAAEKARQRSIRLFPATVTNGDAQGAGLGIAGKF